MREIRKLAVSFFTFLLVVAFILTCKVSRGGRLAEQLLHASERLSSIKLAFLMVIRRCYGHSCPADGH